MIDLPNEAGPAAEFLVRYLYQKVDIELASCNHAIAETANCEDDRWFWHDDNAKVLEFMSRPEVWRRFPTESPKYFGLSVRCAGDRSSFGESASSA